MKKAFTMIELIFVIIIGGILASFISFKFDGDELQEAVDEVVYYLRYTQHLALSQDMYDKNNPEWFKDRWQLNFNRSVDVTDVWAFSIYQDSLNQDGDVNIGDNIAIDILNPKDSQNRDKYLSGGQSGILSIDDDRVNKRMQLYNFGITDIKFSSSCTNNQGINQSRRIFFDELGRPYKNNTSTNPYNTSSLITSDCKITLTHSSGTQKSIIIKPITGLVIEEN